MTKSWLNRLSGKIMAAYVGIAVILTGCANKTVAPQTPTASVPTTYQGRVYPVAVFIPPPVSPRIKFSAAEQRQVQQAFNIIGLKSALMVASLYCNGQDNKYNSFLLGFKPHILAEQRMVDTYFHKASGPFSGRAMEDNFITQLANNQSEAGIQNGSQFCLNNIAEFNAVLALKTTADLDHFATDQPPVMHATNESGSAP